MEYYYVSHNTDKAKYPLDWLALHLKFGSVYF